jgi:hypothetical protein
MTTTTPISFSAIWSERLKQAIDERSIEPYPIACWPNSEDHQALAAAVNVGIDSHLEAVHFTVDTDRRGAPRYWIAADSLSVLIRRLLDGDSDLEAAADDELWEVQQSLASGICSTLGIELV